MPVIAYASDHLIFSLLSTTVNVFVSVSFSLSLIYPSLHKIACVINLNMIGPTVIPRKPHFAFKLKLASLKLAPSVEEIRIMPRYPWLRDLGLVISKLDLQTILTQVWLVLFMGTALESGLGSLSPWLTHLMRTGRIHTISSNLAIKVSCIDHYI